jgi:hypothetical protein
MTMLKKHHIIDDEICYDYLGFVITELYRWSLPFLSKLEKIHPGLHSGFRDCGEKWSTRRGKEEEAFGEAIKRMQETFGTPAKKKIVT